MKPIIKFWFVVWLIVIVACLMYAQAQADGLPDNIKEPTEENYIYGFENVVGPYIVKYGEWTDIEYVVINEITEEVRAWWIMQNDNDWEYHRIVVVVFRVYHQINWHVMRVFDSAKGKIL